MRPPPIALLQVLNALAAVGWILVVMTANRHWTGAGWPSWGIGLAMSAVAMTYATVVLAGGRLADSLGRARTGIVGGAVGLAGAALAWAVDEPWSGVAGGVFASAAIALYYPGAGALISDAEGASGAPPLALHAKVSRYNLGWSTGNFIGFLSVLLLAGQPNRVAYACGFAVFLPVVACLWPWRALPPRPPRAVGDRAAHPALPRLTLMGRLALLIACMLGMGMTGLAERALQAAGAQRSGMVIPAAYAFGYIATFAALGLWSGWVLRPWRLWGLQLGFVVGAGGLAAAALTAPPAQGAIAAAGLALGISYGAVYTASIYYSMSLPLGVGRALGWHESCIGTGNALGPIVAGVFMSWCEIRSPDGSRLAELAWFVAGSGALCLLFQACLIPGITRLGRPVPAPPPAVAA